MNVLLPYWSHPYGGEHHKLFERNKVKKMEEKLFLGIEGSSQSTTAVVIDGKNVVHRESVKYDDIQPPGYILKDGFWELEGNVVLGSPVVWTMGLDHILTGIPKEMRKNIASLLSADPDDEAMFTMRREMERTPGLEVLLPNIADDEMIERAVR